MSRPEVMALLEAAKDSPAEEGPLLVLADWLEEHGDEHDRARAELIRVQGELARLGLAPMRRVELRRRQRDLIAAHGKAWLGSLARVGKGWEFHRGLLQVPGKFLQLSFESFE